MIMRRLILLKAHISSLIIKRNKRALDLIPALEMTFVFLEDHNKKKKDKWDIMKNTKGNDGEDKDADRLKTLVIMTKATIQR